MYKYGKSFLLANMLFFVTNIFFEVKYNLYTTNIQIDILLIASCLFSAIGEEIIFRYFLQKLLINRFTHNTIHVIVITNVLFAISHSINITTYATINYVIIQIICAFSVGCYLSTIAVIDNSIIRCVLIHVLINITALGKQKISYFGQIDITREEGIAYLIVSIIYLCITYKIYKKQFRRLKR